MQIPDFSAAITPQMRAEEFQQAHQVRRETIDRLLAEAPRTFVDFALPCMRAKLRCTNLAATVHHLHAVCASAPGVREAFDAVRTLDDEFSAWSATNPQLAQAYEDILANDPTLDEWQRPWLENVVEGYRLSGIHLPEQERARMREISQQLSALSVQFRRNLQNAAEGWVMELSNDQVQGMPQAARDQLAEVATKKKVASPYAVDLSQPVVMSFLGFCPDRALRRQVWEAYHHQCLPGGVGGEACDNVPLILETLRLRHELAVLRGYEDYAAHQLDDKMAQTPAIARDFLLDLHARAFPKGQQEWAALHAFAQSQGLPVPVMPWDTEYLMQQRRTRELGVDANLVAAHFPYAHVLPAMLGMCEQLFDVRFQRQADVPVWHPSVDYYQMCAPDGTVMGGFYIDPFTRPGKKSGAWKSVAQGAFEGLLPVSHVCCNSAPPSDGGPALMQHREVVTLLHEFGHCLHTLLSKAPFPGVATAGVERDAIECPSQLLENFAWDRGVLRQLSSHHQTAAPLPEDLIDRMLAARFDMAGLTLCRQLVFGLGDLAVHSGVPVESAEALWTVADDNRRAFHPIPLEHGDRMFTQFAHIFCGGYAAGYYGYLWAEALSADTFSAFQESEAGVLDPQVGARFREEVLAVGAKRPFKDSFEAFRGRPLDTQPLLAGRALLDAPPVPARAGWR